MKKLAWILIGAAMIAAMAVPGVALANNGPHGGYVADTDLCAQCHRAHTAPSTLTWTDNQGAKKNALLLTAADTTLAFCLACHDTASQGADTNVMGGVYEGSKYGTPNANLISGAFGSVNANKAAGAYYDAHETTVTSFHLTTGVDWPAFGGGLAGDPDPSHATGDFFPLPAGGGNKIVMSCTTCHDPHGSSNYRILKDVVNGVTVGGYNPTAAGYSAQNPKPTPFVISDEKGFPQGGFQLHVSYVDTYSPNYTKALYAKAPGGDTDTGKGMSGWCAGCHTTYIVADQTPVIKNGVTTVPNGSKYNSGDAFGSVARHRHPLNVPLASYTGTTTLITNDTLGLPLDHDLSEKTNVSNSGNVHNSGSDWIECLTCHNAHGSTATMSGWADLGAQSTEDVVGSRGTMYVSKIDSSLLKMNNRGVCEACHNK